MAATSRNPVAQYFRNIWAGIATTYVGMRVTIGYFFKPKVTMLYPEERPEIPEGHRGLHGYREVDCIACKMCASACPVDCITIESLDKGKGAMLTRFDIDYSMCIFCNLCTEPCPTGCIWMGPEYDLSASTRDGCVIHFATEKTPEEIEERKKVIAEKAAERKRKAAEAIAKKKAAAEAKAKEDSGKGEA